MTTLVALLVVALATAATARPVANATAPAVAPAAPRFLDIGASAEVCVSVDALVFFDWDRCMHGRNCGAGCAHDDPLDALDAACHDHGACKELAYTTADACGCHATLYASASRLVVTKECAWWDIFCDDTPDELSVAATLVTASMTVQMSFDNC